MEDHERGLAAPQEARPPIAEKTHRKKPLTVMIMGSIGRVRSFQISGRIVFWSILFFFVFILVSIFAINSYLHLRLSSSSLEQRVQQVEAENAAYRKVLLRSRQHIALLEDYIQRLEKQPEGASGAGKEGTPTEKTGGASTPTPSGPVDVADMVIQREGARITASFKLVNTQPGEGAVGGYLHLVAVDRKSTPPREWTYPPEKLEKGLPVNYRSGHIFLIARFKQIQGRFALGSASESPTVLRLLVYDQAGDIILQKEFEVSHAS